MTTAPQPAMRAIAVWSVAILASSLWGCMVIESHSSSRIETGGGACDQTYGGGNCEYLIDGVVVDAESGAPIASAEVRVGGYYSYTDGEGVFALTAYVLPGCHKLIASHSDYAPDYTEVALEDRDVTVGPIGLWPAGGGN
ncbi:MAG: hypothetical protein JXR83_09815 [Deltaproteobacteria bacterium]|nr:hypothetical protein [Deltaproteobacteria bacterium]